MTVVVLWNCLCSSDVLIPFGILISCVLLFAFGVFLLIHIPFYNLLMLYLFPNSNWSQLTIILLEVFFYCNCFSVDICENNYLCLFIVTDWIFLEQSLWRKMGTWERILTNTSPVFYFVDLIFLALMSIHENIYRIICLSRYLNIIAYAMLFVFLLFIFILTSY